MKKAIAIVVLLAIILIGGGVGVLYYTNEVMNYVSTDDAKLQGDLVMISAPAAGKLTKWDFTEGEQVHKGDVVGTITIAPSTLGGMPTTLDITAPQDGTIIQSKAITNEYVAPGTPLAMTTDLSQIYVVANIEESDLQDVKVGNSVDITIDAFPNQVFSGQVQQIGLATASTFSLIPSASTGGNYTKVVQRIPVKISLNATGQENLIPGLNATVKIKK